MALDAESTPPRLWVVINTGWGKPQQLAPVTDKGNALELGAPINGGAGLRYPWFMAADAPRSRVLVRERGEVKTVSVVDLGTGKIGSMALPGTDLSTDRDGNLYVMDGYDRNSLSRYTPEGKPLPFAGAGSNKISVAYRAYAPNIGLRGHCVALNGDLYVMRSNNYGLEDGTGGRVDVFGPDGSLKKSGFIEGLGSGDCGLAVDAANNVYLGANVKPKDKPFPEPFMGKVPATGWVWWRAPREGFWDYIYCNPYLYHWGAVLKFGPAGGSFFGHLPNGAKGAASPLTSAANAPAEAQSYWSGYLAREIKVKGAAWRYAGCGIIPTSDVNWGDPACVCMVSHLAADEYGRVYAPNPFRFSVEMLDTGGNHIARIGRYGNADSAGPGSRVPEPEIAFAWPAFVSAAGGKVFVGDCVNRRITVVRFDHAAEELCEVKQKLP